MTARAEKNSLGLELVTQNKAGLFGGFLFGFVCLFIVGFFFHAITGV